MAINYQYPLSFYLQDLKFGGKIDGKFFITVIAVNIWAATSH